MQTWLSLVQSCHRVRVCFEKPAKVELNCPALSLKEASYIFFFGGLKKCCLKKALMLEADWPVQPLATERKKRVGIKR